MVPHQFAQTGTILFELLVQSSTIEMVERLRAGAGFEVSVQVACERLGDRPTVEHDDVTFRVNHESMD